MRQSKSSQKRNIGKSSRPAQILSSATVPLTRELQQLAATWGGLEQLEGRQMLSVPAAPGTPYIASSPTGINVVWSDNSWNESGFTVERSVNGGAFTKVADVGPNGTSYWDPTTYSSTQYTYRVSSYNWEGSSGPSVSNTLTTGWTQNGNNPAGNTVTATPSVTPSNVAPYDANGFPTAPSNLSASATSYTTVQLNWTSNTAGTEVGFKIERSTNGGGFQAIASVGQGVTSYTDDAYHGGVTPGVQYVYRVRAYNWTGDSGYSNTVSINTNNPGTSGTPSTTPTTTPTTPTTPTNTSPYDANGFPTAPSNLSAKATSSTTVQLNWTSNTGGTEIGFKIERSTNGGGFQAIAVVGQGVTTYTDDAYHGGVTPGVQYVYRVRAYNYTGDSSYSNTVSINTNNVGAAGTPSTSPTTTPTTPTTPTTTPTNTAPYDANGFPTAPSNLTATATSSTTIQLNWTSNTAGTEVGFKIERSTNGGGFQAITIVGKGVTTYTDDAYHGGVSPGVQYVYRVRAYNYTGDSGYSNTVSINTNNVGTSGTPGTTPTTPVTPTTPTTPTVPVVIPTTPGGWNPSDTTGYFTIGMFRQDVNSLATWKARGVNTAVFFYPQNPDWMAQYIQVCNQLGLYEIRDPQQNIYADRNDPYLLAYSHDDEPDINGIPTSQLQAEYATWKAANPNIPVIVNVSSLDVQNNYDPTPNWRYNLYSGIFNTADWISSDMYPITAWNRPSWIDKASGVTLTNDGTGIDRIRQWSGGKHQFAYIETSFQNLTTSFSAGARAPTADEFRGESWDAIIHGAKGLLYFPQSFNPNVSDATPPAVVAEMTKNDALITSFGKVLNNLPDSQSNFINLPGGLEATYRDYNGHRYYFVLNFSHNTAWGQTFNLPGLGSGSVEVAGEARSVYSSGGNITDNFAPYAIHIYRV